ncbi:MAG TPA: YoaK family protein [Candidatus Acidoferrales bacterium]|nr:YoaK family protein [Candidatus Acidoferrales bacterium]
MSALPDPMLSRARRDSFVLLLAWAAGGVDAIGYFGLNHVFTANMTGNTVLLGLSLGEGRSLAAISNLIALVGFAAGVALGALIVESGGRPGTWDRRVTAALFLEAVMLAAFTVLWHLSPGRRLPGSAVLYILIAFSALAMGIQSAAVRRLNLPGVATTYVTGTITSLFSGLTALVRSPRPQKKEAAPESGAWNPSAQLQAAVVLTYGLSALSSGYFQSRVPGLVAVAPLLAIAVLLLLVAFSHRKHESRLA